MAADPGKKPRTGDALLVVDVQVDFLPGGSLAVPDGDRVIPVLNRYVALFEAASLPVFVSRDWHPEDHCSFIGQGGRWPRHCVAGSPGAAFAPDLALPRDAFVVSKAVEPGIEAYSAFDSTGLDEGLRKRDVRRLFVGGLATEYCVLATVRDAVKAGFAVMLLVDAIRAVNLNPDDGRTAVQEMLNCGAVAANLSEVAG